MVFNASEYDSDIFDNRLVSWLFSTSIDNGKLFSRNAQDIMTAVPIFVSLSPAWNSCESKKGCGVIRP